MSNVRIWCMLLYTWLVIMALWTLESVSMKAFVLSLGLQHASSIQIFISKYNFYNQWILFYWPDCKAIPAYGLMMSVCPSVRLSVCPSVRPSVCLSTFWLTSTFKFVLGHIYQYRLDTLHENRPWWDLLNCDLPCDPDLHFFCSRSLKNFG